MDNQQPTNQDNFETWTQVNNYKINELIKILRRKDILDEDEATRLLKLRPFPQPAG